MKLCNCSPRPMGIISSKVVMLEGKPYQVLGFGCTNKNCGEYHKIKLQKYINLMDNADTFEKDVQ